jgi:hypothetical protein
MRRSLGIMSGPFALKNHSFSPGSRDFSYEFEPIEFAADAARWSPDAVHFLIEGVTT